MIKIKLESGEWQYNPDKLLGPPGGFGTVFLGRGEEYGEVAVKKLHIDAKDAAHRELRIAKELAGRRLSHVVPVLDSGQDAESDSYFVVMTLAVKSLQEELNDGKIFTDSETANILLQIAEGLSEVGDIVHRDLKPANVLFYDGKWNVADFGIARFVEESTSVRTLKGCLTPAYAAPEQWKFEQSTTATDIYALGCIGYSLVTGQPPFKGTNAALKQQHLSESPPSLNNHNHQLSSLLIMMLRKNPQTRPDLERTKNILKQIIRGIKDHDSQLGLTALAEVGAKVATFQAQEEARRVAEKEKLDRREGIWRDAYVILEDLINKLFGQIERIAPAAICVRKFERPRDKVFTVGIISLGEAQLRLGVIKQSMRAIPQDAFSRSKLDVVAGAFISVIQKQPDYTWASSLWYVKTPGSNNYRWHEVSYFARPSVPIKKVNAKYQPFALVDIKLADAAGSSNTGQLRIAFGPRPIDDENFEDFCDRWAGLLAKAANGELCRPRVLPIEEMK